MIWAEALLPGFLFGVANSAHCAGMCGVFALHAGRPSGIGETRTPAALRMALYLVGKGFTYVFLGALAGWLGARVLGTFTGAQTVLGASVGAVLIVAGWRLLRPARPTRIGLAVSRLLSPLFATTYRARESGSSFTLGALTGAIPCGVVYLAALQGAALGSPLEGALLMFAFGLGTGPVLLGVGLLGRQALRRLGPRTLRLAGGSLVISAGIFGLVRALLPLFVASSTGGAPCCH